MTVLAHMVIALAIANAVVAVTGLWWMPLLVGALYPIREIRQYYKGKGAGWAAALVPALACAVMAGVLYFFPAFLDRLI